MTDVRRIDAGSPDALWLVSEMVAGLGVLYGQKPGDGPSANVEDLSPPGGGFVAIYVEGKPVAGGGVKQLEPGLGEVKRMYVAPEMRSRGLARTLLAALEDLARDLGHTRLRLDTGPEQPHARALYLSAGYLEIPDYNDNQYAAFWGEKNL